MKDGQVVALSGGDHNHPPHTEKIRKLENLSNPSTSRRKQKPEPNESDYITKQGNSMPNLDYSFL